MIEINNSNSTLYDNLSYVVRIIGIMKHSVLQKTLLKATQDEG